MKTAKEFSRHSTAILSTVATSILIGAGIIGVTAGAGAEERVQPEPWRGTDYSSSQETAQEPTPVPAAATPEESPPGKEEPKPRQSDHGVAFTFGFDVRKSLSGDYEGYYGVRPVVQMFSTRHHGGGMTAAIGELRLASDSAAHRAATDPLFLDFGFFYRFYATPPHTFLRPYVGLHGNFTWMTWTYRDDIIIGNDEIGSDSVGGVDGCVAAGVVLNVSRSFHAFGEFGFGGVTFLSTTDEDLKNTLFDDFGYLSIKAGLGFSF
jgi:hypothetical protein